MLGISSGAPFAAATTAVSADRVTALGIVVGVGPWRELEPMDDLDLAREREILDLVDKGRMEEALLAYRGLAAGWYDDLLAKRPTRNWSRRSPQ